VGFAFRTMPGHPASGEEAFGEHRRDCQRSSKSSPVTLFEK
jgi:hypothetical protein